MTRIAITGLGISTHLGEGLDSNWSAVTVALTPRLTSGGDLSPEGRGASFDYSHSAVAEALKNAQLNPSEMDSERIGCTFSASKPLLADGIQAPEVVNESIRWKFGLAGEARNVIAACATGAYSVALGASWIEQGLCDVVVAGSFEPPIADLYSAGFRQMGVLSGEAVMRPFDKDRSGFVFGHGAGAIVLESQAHARARGISPRLLLSGWAMGADGHSAVAFNSGGMRIAEVMRRSIQKAGLTPADIRHLNAHGTATRLNDALETQAIKHVFGASVGGLNISGTKSSTGHLLGAAGSVELVLTALALQYQRVPPTRHLDHPDAACDLNFTPHHSVAQSFKHAMSVSFGFGGPIGSLVVSQC